MSNLQHCESPLVQIDLSQFDRVTGIELSELAFHGHINLRGQLNNSVFCTAVSEVLEIELPIKSNCFVMVGELKIYWLGPDEWLIVTPPNQQTELINKLQQALKNIFASVTDVSSAQTIIGISGSNARALIEKGCTIDLHPGQFKKGDCAQTHLAKASVLLSVQNEEVLEYEVIVRRSFSDYLGLWLLDSVHEYSD